MLLAFDGDKIESGLDSRAQGCWESPVEHVGCNSVERSPAFLISWWQLSCIKARAKMELS